MSKPVENKVSACIILYSLLTVTVTYNIQAHNGCGDGGGLPLMATKYRLDVCVCVFVCLFVYRPDITVPVDWA